MELFRAIPGMKSSYEYADLLCVAFSTHLIGSGSLLAFAVSPSMMGFSVKSGRPRLPDPEYLN
jgi:hypothetical protein